MYTTYEESRKLIRELPLHHYKKHEENVKKTMERNWEIDRSFKSLELLGAPNEEQKDRVRLKVYNGSIWKIGHAEKLAGRDLNRKIENN